MPSQQEIDFGIFKDAQSLMCMEMFKSAKLIMWREDWNKYLVPVTRFRLEVDKMMNKSMVDRVYALFPDAEFGITKKERYNDGATTIIHLRRPIPKEAMT